MKTFKFTYRRKGSWLKKSKVVIGNQLLTDLDRMVLYAEDGSVFEIPNWSECECWLGTDWVLFTKTRAEEKAGVEVKLAQGIGG